MNPIIKIEDLTERQMMIADLLWYSRDPYRIIESLPTEKDKLDALSLMDIIICECIEQELGLEPAEDVCNTFLKKIMEK